MMNLLYIALCETSDGSYLLLVVVLVGAAVEIGV